MFGSKKYQSPHFEKTIIPVEFVVIHYTAQSLKESLKIFLDAHTKNPVSCHLLIDEEGQIYELVSCSLGECYKAFHAGRSCFLDSDKKHWKDFNNFSIGIELVNLNGNFCPFTERQYQQLFKVLLALKKQYPALENPERIIGHEQIAGFRGKSDPGYLFDWERLFKQVYHAHFEKEEVQEIVKKRSELLNNKTFVSKNTLKELLKTRHSVLTKKQYQSLTFLTDFQKWNDKKAKGLSLLMEKSFLPFWLKKILFWFLISRH